MIDSSREDARRFRTLTGLTVRSELALEATLAEAETIYNDAPCGYHSLDDDGTFVQINDTELRWLGLKREDVVGRLRFTDVLADPESLARFEEGFALLKATGKIRNVEVRLRTRDGDVLTALVNASAVYGDQGQFVMSRATLFDITARQQASAALQRTHRALRVKSACTSSVIRAQDEMTLLQGICRICVDVGKYRMAWVGIPQQDETRTVRPVAYAGFDDGYLQTIRITWGRDAHGSGPTGTAVRTGTSQVNQDFLTNPRTAPWRDDARARGYQSSIALPLKDGDGVIGVVTLYASEANAFDTEEVDLLTELADDVAFGMVALRQKLLHRRAEERIEQLAYFDPLTRLPNRARLMVALAEASERLREHHVPFALVTINVSRFGEIQARLGVRQADAALRSIADRIASAMRPEQWLARTGSDEFAVLIHGGNAEDARACAAAVEHALAEPIQQADIALWVQVRFGTAVAPDSGDGPEALLLRSALAARQARQSGIRFALYSGPTDAESPRYLMLTSGLRSALDRRQIVVHYQPVVDLVTHQVSSVEALVRWDHPQRGVVMPNEFIGIAEQTGLIQPLTRYVVNVVARQAARWREQGFHLPIAVNVSVESLADPEFPAFVEDTVTRLALPAGSLHFEITESALMKEPERARELLMRFHALGIPTSIDDFGTGYSSLAYVALLPIQSLKIDRSFVGRLIESDRMRAVIAATLSLATSLNLTVVAEGVETQAQAQALQQMGCTKLQGWLYSPALDGDAIVPFVRGFAPR